jgi:hypothetical protein
MTYRVPSFSSLHAAADAGIAAITSDNEHASFPLDNLIDYRNSSLFKFSTAAVDHWIKIDRAAVGENINRIIIPAGHNLDGATLSLQYAASDSWPGTVAEGWTQSGAAIIDRTLDDDSTARWWRLSITTSGQWEIPQLWLTRKRTPTRGPDPDWGRYKVSGVRTVAFPSRTASLSLGPVRVQYRMKWNHLDSTDLTIFDELLAEVGVDLLPFYIDPPDDNDDALLVKIVGRVTLDQDSKNPASDGPAYRAQFTMLEESG